MRHDLSDERAWRSVPTASSTSIRITASAARAACRAAPTTRSTSTRQRHGGEVPLLRAPHRGRAGAGLRRGLPHRGDHPRRLRRPRERVVARMKASSASSTARKTEAGTGRTCSTARPPAGIEAANDQRRRRLHLVQPPPARSSTPRSSRRLERSLPRRARRSTTSSTRRCGAGGCRPTCSPSRSRRASSSRDPAAGLDGEEATPSPGRGRRCLWPWSSCWSPRYLLVADLKRPERFL